MEPFLENSVGLLYTGVADTAATDTREEHHSLCLGASAEGTGSLVGSFLSHVLYSKSYK
jgi:hypothetical protein